MCRSQSVSNFPFVCEYVIHPHLQEDIGGGRSARGLQVNDMVLMVNNKTVGGMTEDDLEVELEISGEELILVVSQYNGGPMKGQLHEDESEKAAETWHELDNGAFDWQEMGPGSRAIVPSAVGRLSEPNLDVDGTEPRMASGGETAPDVSKLRRETFRAQANHDDHPLASQHNDMPARSGAEERKQSADSESTRLFTSHTNATANSAEKSEQQVEVQSRGASAQNAAGFRSGEEYTRRVRGSSIDEDGDALLGGSQEDGEDSANDGGDVPGLSLSRIMADFAQPKKKRGSNDDDDEENENVAKSPPNVEKGTPSTSSTDVRAREVIADWNAEGEDGDDPELGCICGAIHAEPEPVFWLHCDTCQSWYNNSVRCVGFDQEAADKMVEWTCPSCGGEPAIPHEGAKKASNPDEEDDELDDALPIGSRVNVVVGKDLWKGTIRKVGKKHGDIYYRVNLDGNRQATLSTVFSYQIHSLIGEAESQKGEREKEIDRCNSLCSDSVVGSKRSSGVAFRSDDFDDESEERPPKKKPTHTTLTTAADENSEEDEFVITESEALFLSGNDNIGNPQPQTDPGTNFGERSVDIGSESQLAETQTIGGGDQPLALEPTRTDTTGTPVTLTKAKEQKKPKPGKKLVERFETVEEIDENIVEFKDCGKIERRQIDWDHTPISVGSLVRVADRSAGASAGNKLGGIAKVMGRRGNRADNNLVYDVRYVIGGTREFDVSWTYVVLNSVFDSAGGGDDVRSNGRGGSRRSRSSNRPSVLDPVLPSMTPVFVKIRVKCNGFRESASQTAGFIGGPLVAQLPIHPDVTHGI